MKQLIILIAATLVIFNSYSKSWDDQISKTYIAIGIANYQNQDDFDKKSDKTVNPTKGKRNPARKFTRKARRLRKRAGRVGSQKRRINTKNRKTGKQFRRAAKNAKRK